MFKKSILIVSLFLAVIYLTAVNCTKIPKQINDWRVEVGPTGNEFYQIPEKTTPENKPPSEKLLNIVSEFAPSYTEISEWKLLKDNLYWIRSEAGPEKYDYYITLEGKIQEIVYKNDSTNTREKAYALLIKGSKKAIPLEQVPPKALKTIELIFPDSKAGETWIASTFAGDRYVIVVERMVFYARDDGQIQSARLIKEGGLEENYPVNKNEDEVKAEILSEAGTLLDDFRDRFNIDNQIAKLNKKQNNMNNSFRFVVMGDSRSNNDLWENINKHIAMLDPQPDFIINTGDIVTRGFVKEFREYFIPPLLNLDIPYFVAIGNHDVGFKKQAIEYRYLFGENSLNYYFDYYNYRFIFIDNVTSVCPMEETVEWLKKILSETPDNYSIIVSLHRPFGNIDRWSYHAMDKEHSKMFTDLMSKYKVKHVFCGHIHAYSTATLNGIDYTVTGGAGAGLYKRYGPKGNVHHYIICDVSTDGTLKQQVVRFYKTE